MQKKQKQNAVYEGGPFMGLIHGCELSGWVGGRLGLSLSLNSKLFCFHSGRYFGSYNFIPSSTRMSIIGFVQDEDKYTRNPGYI